MHAGSYQIMRRRKQQPEENHERWLVSYADFITLLFAFFVVMYALSSINEGKYRVLSDALEAAFRSTPRSMAPIQVGRVSYGQNASALNLEHRLAQLQRDMSQLGPEKTIAGIADTIEGALAKLIEDDIVDVRRDALWIEVEINTSILFPSGSARLAAEAVPVIQTLARILRPFANRLHVEGFTDNLPINTKVYPSNWELSAARAARVVRLLGQHGVASNRMVAIGHGENQPKADNNTASGRRQNRRVVLTILADTETPMRHALPDTRLKELAPRLAEVSDAQASPVLAPHRAGARDRDQSASPQSSQP